MVFNLRNNRDLFLVVLLLFTLSIIEYFIPSRLTSVSAYIIGALSFICVLEICQYLIKPFTPKKSHNLTFFIFIIGLALLILWASCLDLLSKAYVIGTYLGLVLAIILKFFGRKEVTE